MDIDQSDTNFLLTRFSVLIIIYAFSLQILPNSKLPIAVFLLGMSSSLYKTKAFSWIVKKFIQKDINSDRQDLINAVQSFQMYKDRALGWNKRKYGNLKRISYDDYIQAKKIGYYDHLTKTDKAIESNAQLANAIAKQTIQNYGITDLEIRSAVYKDNSRVIESLCHFARDWTSMGDVELKPLFDYILNNLNKTIPGKEERSKTVVLVPGSGLGRIAHELSLLTPKFDAVHTIEFSYLMHLCNEFVYSKTQSSESYKIHPFIHTYSHHVSEENQLRSVEFKTQPTKPQNLTTNYGDFRKFQIPNLDKYDNVVIVTAFFIDTAQNLFEYFDSIERLIGEKSGTWINIGPLKYGTAPKVEFSLEELRKLRKLRGWKDLDEPKPYGSEISGYLTDTKGLWQGYYGLGRWTSSFTSKKK
ncbi:hypothetical protein BN7_584 [Wickerhamomyces ciferrii]|uniref:Uncharacterized protein n=1 Tax=Wickerhamomyces ciferrii (strain ATCC 14091 / BCRC 22168 / CBS 111 / JCM 3599 / NBRC 0793 / NRRL Y-1031 F-60-10) TaxID=1206466 RepID=K0KFN5_WICCF|nr:uncharacterized protein BN7_584 [Wickerhamomyces ciferrii]CCH41047.1 hypothetical protein BN7_584 [Wickerhamomyces ciferrii]